MRSKVLVYRALKYGPSMRSTAPVMIVVGLSSCRRVLAILLLRLVPPLFVLDTNKG
jgi:hypothetical protein